MVSIKFIIDHADAARNPNDHRGPFQDPSPIATIIANKTGNPKIFPIICFILFFTILAILILY